MDSSTERKVSVNKTEVSIGKRERSVEKDTENLTERKVLLGCNTNNTLFVRNIKRDEFPYIDKILPDAIKDIIWIDKKKLLVKLPDYPLEEAKQKLHDAGVDVNYEGTKGGEITRRTIALHSPFLTEEEVKAMILEPVKIYRVHNVSKGMEKGSLWYYKIVFPTREVVGKYCWKFKQQNLDFNHWTKYRLKGATTVKRRQTYIKPINFIHTRK